MALTARGQNETKDLLCWQQVGALGNRLTLCGAFLHRRQLIIKYKMCRPQMILQMTHYIEKKTLDVFPPQNIIMI